ncbi:MAG TPA: hypothetical protein VFA97_11625 [Gaiellaceae bacterium]|nr:hypothetical protein [Gaiellaceae bacterium]
MALAEDLERIAGRAAEHGEVAAVLAAEPGGSRRVYLVALGAEAGRRWAVFDAAGRLVTRRDDVRDAASIVAMCELAEEVAGGGDLERLRADLAQLRVVEQPPGIEAAEEAALALERVLGAPPRVASPAFLDEVGAATIRLEQALGEVSSPFSAAIRGASGAVDEFVRDVERDYLGELQ